ncbi:MAG: YkgJ family cysteine cluster protein [Bacillota bacterium]
MEIPVNAADESRFKALNPEDRFTFECSEKCMGKCCRLITILLDPWDIEAIARHIKISGPDFLDIFCRYEFGTVSNWPFAWLKQAETGNCAFLLEDGRCSIYPVRPRNCRMYPIGRAVRFEDVEGTPRMREKLFMVEWADHCLGHEASRTWTVKEWLEDSGADKYFELSDAYLSVVDYATRELNSTAWLTSKTARLLMPLIFIPDTLRTKLNINEEAVDHETFYHRRLNAARMVLTEMAASFGFGPLAGTTINENTSIAERIRQMILID